MALRAESIGLLYKAGQEAVSGGWSVARKGGLAVLPLAVDLPVACSSFAAVASCGGSRRSTLNSQLRTGTDQGNPTV